MTKSKKKLYPIEYNNKLYYKKDVDELFFAFYNDRDIYELGDGSVYVADGLSVYPDGITKDESNDLE